MIDGGLRNLFHKHLKKYGVHFQAIETGGTTRGVPDSNGCYNGVEFWVEFKKTSTYRVNLEAEQVAWHLQRSRAKGRVYVAVRRKRSKSKRIIACDELWLFLGRDSARLQEGGLNVTSIQPLAIFTGGPVGWPWPRILEILIGDN